MSDNCVVTLACTRSGRSESLPVSRDTTTVSELCDWSKALFGLEGEVCIFKDGNRIQPVTLTLSQANIVHGDLLAVQELRLIQQMRQQRQQQQQQQQAVQAQAQQQAAVQQRSQQPQHMIQQGGGRGGGLDFSNLLSMAPSSGGRGGASVSGSSPSGAAAASASSGGLDFSGLLAAAGSQNMSAGSSSGNAVGAPVYYPSMNLNEAMSYNPNPATFMKLLFEHDHLLKELNYHNPVLAQKVRSCGGNIEEAAKVWREEMFRGGIQSAISKSQKNQKEQQYRRRLQANPNDEEAKNYFAEQERAVKVEEQYRQMMQEFPESLGRILMLYINAKINGHPIQAFVDSGAQTTIMSRSTAESCGLLDWLDTRFAGTAVGVGTGVILGRIHIVQLQIGDYHFPCTVTVMDDSNAGTEGGGQKMEFLLGLDMLKRHTCSIDLEEHVLKFRLGPSQYMTTPFLHEKDLDQSKGGTKGFNAEKANERLEQELQRQEQDEQKQNGNENKNEDEKNKDGEKMQE